MENPMRYVMLLMILIVPLWAHGATLLVPEEYATIQAAVDASSNGDEVVVSPGVYDESISINRSIILRSTFDGKDWSLVENTVINRSNPFSTAIFPGSGKPTIRGFRITRDPIDGPLPNHMLAIGINGTAIIEYNIIENQVYSTPNGTGGGAAIVNCYKGLIQNNIIRNNRANNAGAISNTGETAIRNNVFYENGGDICIAACTGPVINNTFHNNSGGLLTCTGAISNNILWQDDPLSVSMVVRSSGPENCIIKSFTGPGVNIINADPKFVDPENGDFRLKADSPAIDAGKAVPEVKADLLGVQRGQKAKAVPLGDGSNVDIGAYEFIPKPVAVWLPDGGPDTINPGDDLAVAWETDLETAGTAVTLRLQRKGVTLADFGPFFNQAGMDTVIVSLPADLIAAPDYYFQAVSAYNPALSGQSPPLAIHSPYSALPGGDWSMYR
jgi:hypothetical protein